MSWVNDLQANDPLDVQRVVQLICADAVDQPTDMRGLFDDHIPMMLSRAPGRLDVMGGIADYSGSLVLEMPIAEAAVVVVQPRADRQIRIVSLGGHAAHRSSTFVCDLDEVAGVSYDVARVRFAREAREQWAGYVAGVLTVLSLERGIRWERGVSILLASDVPEGKGVASSAAVEVATMRAVAGMLNLHLDGESLAMLCQLVENRVVGAPCGVMDQMTCACGRADHLMRLLCQPAILQGHVRLPDGVAVWGIDSGIRHAVSGADYGSVRAGAFMGRTILGHPDHLANITPLVFDAKFCDRLPVSITGREFLDRHPGGHGDAVTTLHPDREYAVRVPTRHPVMEHARVRRFAEVLAGPMNDDAMVTLGELMDASHDSYSACGLGSAGTDELVERVRRAGPTTGLFGAKITGGGSGGTVAVLGRADALPAVQRIAEEYARATGRAAHIFQGSSPGAVAFGVRQLMRKKA